MGELPSCEGRDHDTNAELLPRVTLLRSLGGNGLSHTSLCDGSSLKYLTKLLKIHNSMW